MSHSDDTPVDSHRGRTASSGRTARLERRDGKLVAVAERVVTDDDVLGLLDSIPVDPRSDRFGVAGRAQG